MEKENKLSNGMKHLLIMIGIAVLLMFAGILHVDAAPMKNDNVNTYYCTYYRYADTDGYQLVVSKHIYNTDVRICLVKAGTDIFTFTDASGKSSGKTVTRQLYHLFGYDEQQGEWFQSLRYDNYETKYYKYFDDNNPYSTSEGGANTNVIDNMYYYLNNGDYDLRLYNVKETNIPIVDSIEDAEIYLKSGYIKPKEVYDESFTLTGFTSDNKINASWSGFRTSNWVDATKMEVNIEPRYFIILEAGEEEQEFEIPEKEVVKYSDYQYYKNYDDFFIDNPYKERCELILYFYPTYLDTETNTLYKGKSIVVTFDKKGSIDDVHIPEVALTASYDDNFYLKNFIAKNEFHNWSDCFVHTYWTGSSIDNEVDYVYSDIKVQLYARKGSINDSTYEWIDFDKDDIISIRDNSMSFNLTELDDYCRTKGYRFYDSTHQWKNEKIRITPYYKTVDSYHYGRSVEITLTTLAGIESVLQSKGDAFDSVNPPGYDDLQEDYFSDGSFKEDIYEDLINSENGSVDINNITLNFFTILGDLLEACGQFPALVSKVFSFLPELFSHMLIGALSLVIILRLLGR